MRGQHFERARIALRGVLFLPVRVAEVAQRHERIRDLGALEAAVGETHHERTRREMQRARAISGATLLVGASLVRERP